MSSHADQTLLAPNHGRLLAIAGGLRLAVAFDVVGAVGTPGSIVAVPGAQSWLRGLTVWRGRLHTVIDAGLLFGQAPATAASLIVLKGLGIDVALAVDELPRPCPEEEPADFELDLASLSVHPAFQPGSGMRGAA